MKQFRLLKGFFYRKRYIPALDYTIEDFGNGERLNICYKTFQRQINKNPSGYFVEINKIKFWIKVEDAASNAIPETFGGTNDS